LWSAQEARLEEVLIACQRLYNAALEQRRDAYRKQGKTLSRYDQQKELTELRANDPFFRSLSTVILRSALFRLDRAYKAFFRRVKNGEKPGFPRYKARDRYDSFSFDNPVINEDTLSIPKIGDVRLKLYRPLRGVIKECHIRRSASGGWYASFVCDLGDAPAKAPPERVVGVDVGLKQFAVVAENASNTLFVENPRFYRESEETLARRQRVLAHKRKRSNARSKAKRLVAKTHERIRNQRLDHARKLAKTLLSQCDAVAYEDLNIRGMVRSSLGKSINDAAWSVFISCLAFKAEEAGKWALGVDPRGTTQRCSRCHVVVPKTLADREHVCPNCGLCLDRDVNAALNIRALGLSAVSREVAKATSLAEAKRLP
jgi:putative transposase